MDRSEAIRALAEAIARLSADRPAGEQPIARINIAPIDLRGADWTGDCHSVDLTATELEALTTATEAVPDRETLARITRDGQPRLRRTLDALADVDWDALNANSQTDRDAFADKHGDLAGDLTDLFTGLDPREMNRTVMDHREVDLMTAVQALDDVFGEIADPYADEDDA
ncbi:hypothetical protein [Streptomyces sp. NPDC046862]|uniref:hypothetical protein n=1 Tax=Streptomyces sp. NPDC046862 TaxID=3154603 RepID=UPI00345355E4